MFMFSFNIGEEVIEHESGRWFRVHRNKGDSYQLVDENGFTTVKWFNERDLINNRKKQALREFIVRRKMMRDLQNKHDAERKRERILNEDE